jgi:post-segregation antitoxin (ccd killing protein)
MGSHLSAPRWDDENKEPILKESDYIDADECL